MIDIAALPFNAHIGVERCLDGEHLLTLPFAEHVTNHVGTIHASAIFGLAEASSGEFLIRNLADRDGIVAVVRKARSKFSAPATATIFSKVGSGSESVGLAVEELLRKGRAICSIEVVIEEASGETIGRFEFDWFLTRDAGSG